MNMRIWALSLVVGTSLGISVFTQAGSPARRTRDLQVSTDNSTKCNPDDCTYSVQNYPGDIGDLIARANKRTFGDQFMPDPEIEISKNGSSEIYIQLKEPYKKKRDEYLQHLRNLDVLPVSTRKYIEIALVVTVYTFVVSDIDNIKIGISNKISARPRPKAELSVGGSNSLNLGIPVNIWEFANSIFGLNLDVSRVTSNIELVNRFETTVTNGDSLTAAFIKMKLNPEGSVAGTMVQAPTGLTLNGKVSLDRFGNTVDITDFNLKYSIPVSDFHFTAEDTVVPRKMLQLTLDEPKVLWKRTENENSKSKDHNWIVSANDVQRGLSLVNIITVTASLVDDHKQSDSDGGTSLK